MKDSELLALHRDIVALPSISGEEAELAGFLSRLLARHDIATERVGDNLYALLDGEGPLVCLNSHLDTVPPSAAWSRPPYLATVHDGKVYGLGSNDAKASVAAMVAACIRLHAAPRPRPRVLLTLVAAEETGGKGTEALLPHLAARGLTPDAVIVGEPTGLDIAIAQKGLLVLELLVRGRACHAAHAHALGAKNALRLLAHDLVALDSLTLGATHQELGPVTLEPTLAAAGTAKNVVPALATCTLDVRTNPEPTHEQLIVEIGRAVRGDIKVVSKRLRPCSIAPTHPLVRAAQEARPEARLFGSRGVSDLVFFCGIPGIKVGPGDTERSHTADEFVLESEVLAGAQFYERAVLALRDLAPRPAAVAAAAAAESAPALGGAL